MKLYTLLIAVLMVAASGVGYFAFSFKNHYNPSQQEKFQVNLFKRKFVGETEDIGSFNVDRLYPSSSHKALFSNRATDLSRYAEVFYDRKDCFKLIENLIPNFNDHKVVFWEQFRCKLIKRLPGSFFSQPPFVHPSGQSYVYLFFRLMGENKVDQSWLFNHLEYVKPSEFSYFIKLWKKLPAPYQTIAELSEENREQIIKGSPSILTKDYYLVLEWDVFNFFENIYKVYDRKSFENFLEVNESPFAVTPYKSHRQCLIKDGDVCWNFSLAYLVQREGYTNLVIAIILFLFMVITLVIIYFTFSKEKNEDEKRKFALRVLSHELRTPLTSMMLRLETLLSSMDKFSEEDQDQVLKLSSDAHRLRRLIELSRNYLSAQNNKKVTQINKKEIPSVNDYVRSCLEEYPDVELIPLEIDSNFILDEYWFRVCLKNLVENALNHGKLPVTVSLKVKSHQLTIGVSDGGKCEFEKLSEMTREFVKGNSSQGTGLGLNIVMKMIREMGGKLNFSRNPTTFTITLSGDLNEQTITG